MVDVLEKLVIGTAAIGLPYGLPGPNGATPNQPSQDKAINLLRRSADAGIRIFDTAPAYGTAEALVGMAFKVLPDITVWSKLDQSACGPGDWSTASSSLRRSLERLSRPRLDLLQYHNWTAVLAEDPGFRRAWAELGCDGRIAALGCSTYGEADALAAVESGLFTVVQVEWNLLNQAVVDKIAEQAVRRGIRIAARSVFLQGVLTDKGASLPPYLAALNMAREKACWTASAAGRSLYSLALRAALDHPALSYVLVGLDHLDQLTEALAVVADRPLDAAEQVALRRLHLGGPMTDPRTWAK